jgi:hypothetical protein
MLRIYVTNPWTKIPHGHARTELITLRDLLRVNLLDCSIISETEDFGDVLIDESDLYFKSRFFSRNPLYTIIRILNVYKYFASVQRKFKLLSNFGDKLIITSANFEQFLISAMLFGRKTLHIRVFNCPENDLSVVTRIVLKLLLIKNKFVIGVETKEINNWFKINLNLETQIVPPINRLQNQNEIKNKTIKKTHTKNIGIIYPVTSDIDIEELLKIIEIFKTEYVQVKLPIGLPYPAINQKAKIIMNGISDRELEEYLENLDAVVLMNHNYINRGSGLLTLCMSLGKIIYVFEDNNFVNTYKELYPLNSFKNVEQIAEDYKKIGVRSFDKKSLYRLSCNFVEYVDSSWRSFINA